MIRVRLHSWLSVAEVHPRAHGRVGRAVHADRQPRRPLCGALALQCDAVLSACGCALYSAVPCHPLGGQVSSILRKFSQPCHVRLGQKQIYAVKTECPLRAKVGHCLIYSITSSSEQTQCASSAWAEMDQKQTHAAQQISRYSITSSASSKNDSRTDRPSALAVLRLTTSSNFSGDCTGKSAGDSPLRMRLTYELERRKISTVSGP